MLATDGAHLFITYSCLQWHYEQVWPRRNERSGDACSAVVTSANAPRFSYPYGAMNFMAAWQLES